MTFLSLYPGGGLEWGWDETGTRQWPGIQPVGVTELLAPQQLSPRRRRLYEQLREEDCQETCPHDQTW